MKRLLDFVSLSPTRHSIDAGLAQRVAIPFTDGQLEAVRYLHEPSLSGQTLLLLKFVGAGGRAENLTPHPLEHWPELSGTAWSVNPPGFGNSRGKPQLASIVPAALALYDHALAQCPHPAKVLVMGTSLGAATALAVAARRPIDALLLRDAPDLFSVITKRFSWRTLGLARLAARHVPDELDAFSAGAQVQAPAVFVTAGKDRIVPIAIQRKVVSQYGGPKQVVHLPNADHGSPLEQADVPRYVEALGWLRSHLAV